MGIKGAFIMPHPPIMVEEVGGKETEKIKDTVAFAKEIGKRIGSLKPEIIVIITPHGSLFSDVISVSSDPVLTGDLGNFRAPGVSFKFENDVELAGRIVGLAVEDNVNGYLVSEDLKKKYRQPRGLDHGATVPLYFVNKYYENYKLVHITYSMLSHEDHYKFGIAIKKAIEELGRKAVVIASGDLSHRLTHDAPSGFDPKGAEFDRIYVESIKSGDIGRLMSLDRDFVEAAGVCALHSTIVLFGCLDGCSVEGEVLSYEGPFGVGYCIAEMHVGNCGKGSKILEEFMEYKRNAVAERRAKEDTYVRLARTTLENYVLKKDEVDISKIALPEMLTEKAGVFVSIKKDGDLRGCIGTILPTRNNIAVEIVYNAISAGTQDPRFDPIEEEELDDLVYSVDILGEPEPIRSKELLDVKRYGVIVRKGNRFGLLLPNLEGVDSIDQQVSIALRKAGIPENEDYQLERFEVIRHY